VTPSVAAPSDTNPSDATVNFLIGATTEAHERILTENRRFRSDGVSLTQNFKVEGSPLSTILLFTKLG